MKLEKGNINGAKGPRLRCEAAAPQKKRVGATRDFLIHISARDQTSLEEVQLSRSTV